MTRVTIRVSLVLATLVLSPGFPSAHDRPTIIHFTMNENPMLYPGAECIGIIATETILAMPNDIVRWQVRSGHGGGRKDEDRCVDGKKPMNMANVQLVFSDGVVGATTLTSDASGKIQGTAFRPNMGGKTPHKYHVMYKGVVAGPDPEIDVDCPSCGTPGGGPTK